MREIRTVNVDENGNMSFDGLFKMIRVEGGTFMMGASGKCLEEARGDETPAHEVTLDEYYIGETAVTRDLWFKLMTDKIPEGGRLPVAKVTWFDCHKLIRKLNRLTEGKYYFFLPTEAQWEFAARGGVKSQGYKYSGSDILDEVAWYGENSEKKRHPVASKKPNELGVYDMSGNIGEWCEDEWDGYPEEPQTNPDPEAEGAYKIFRGGSFQSAAARCRVSNRSSCSPRLRQSIIGFRLAMRSRPE